MKDLCEQKQNEYFNDRLFIFWFNPVNVDKYITEKESEKTEKEREKTEKKLEKTEKELNKAIKWKKLYLLDKIKKKKSEKIRGGKME